MGKYIQGKYKPLNPAKYVGDIDNIVFRSSWERKFFVWADRNPSVLRWGSEIHPIPYFSKVDGRVRRYFPDLFIRIKKIDGSEEVLIAEIKPECQTRPPKEPTRKTKKSQGRLVEETLTYQRNKDKWEAAEQFAKKKGMRFVILTEKELGIK
jgi:hypothetical protein